jgi:RNA polymerase sigma factor (sigma-70 family)
VPASDERLVKRIRGGSDEAFTLLYERYQARLLSFCRHMLGSQAEAEDAVQQCFVNAYRDILRDEKDLHVRPWLYRIARNQCLSMLRARRFEPEVDDEQVSLRGLSEEVAERTELRDLLHDLERLPADQREALVLSELNDNSHAEVARILGCDREKVKSLVFQARASLIKSREARALPCDEVQRRLSVLRGGSLRRTELRRHVAECPACRAFREQVKAQRAALAVLLPVAPSTSLKLGGASVLAAAKASAGAGATGAVATSTAGTGAAATLAAKLGVSGTVLKGIAATVAVTAAVGGGAAVEVAQHRGGPAPLPNGAPTSVEHDQSRSSAEPGRGSASPKPGAQRHTGRPARGRETATGEHPARGNHLGVPSAVGPGRALGDAKASRPGAKAPSARRRPARMRKGASKRLERLRERKPDKPARTVRPERDAPAVIAPALPEEDPALPDE